MGVREAPTPALATLQSRLCLYRGDRVKQAINSSGVGKTSRTMRPCFPNRFLNTIVMNRSPIATSLNVSFFVCLLIFGGRPRPELCFLPGRLRWTLLAQEALRQFIQWLWIEHLTCQLRGGHITTELLQLWESSYRPKLITNEVWSNGSTMQVISLCMGNR